MINIVVIDDSPEVLTICEALLSPGGYNVISFTSGKQAVDALRTTPVDLIVTDIYMPDHDGLDVIREARRICPQTPIIAMSGMTGSRDMMTPAGLLGACCTLAKPFSKRELLQVVEAVLESRQTPMMRRCRSGAPADSCGR